jgi:hypothetical protein
MRGVTLRRFLASIVRRKLLLAWLSWFSFRLRRVTLVQVRFV